MTTTTSSLWNDRTRRLITIALAAAAALAAAVLVPVPAPAASRTAADDVQPIAWARFTAGLPDDQQAQRARAILLNTNKYALQTWFPAKYGSQTDYYLDLGGVAEGSIRPPGSEALALATSLATGAYDEAVTGVPADEATDAAVRITASIALHHKVNDPAGWGDAWQSALWAFNASFAGWLLWDQLPAADRENLAEMVVAEADRFLHYDVPYYQRPDGTVVTPSDTKAEENAWNAAFMNLAVSMMPEHPNAKIWQQKALELMISAYSRPSDLEDTTELNGKPVQDWLNGSNIFDDGTLVNHSIIHPDYFTSIANSVGAPLAYGLAGRATPRAALFNADLVYDTLVDHEFSSPPYASPGGTIYVRDADGAATSQVYYPQGNDWGTSRQLHFVLLDTLASVFGFDTSASRPAADWAAAHADRALEMQARFDDGRTYGAPSEDTYSGREEWVALLAGRTYLTHWLDHNADIRFTNRDYAVTPADYPGGSLTLDAAANYPKGVATPLNLTVQSESDEPLKNLSVGLELPPGWEAEPVGDVPDVLEQGESVTATWQVTPGESVAEATTEIRATADYRHRGVRRHLESKAFVSVPPGINLALGAPVTVSSALRPENGGGKVVDGLFTDASRWLSAESDTAPVLTIDLEQAADIDAIYVYSGYTRTNHDLTSVLKDFTVEVRGADGWTQVGAVADNTEHRVVIDSLEAQGDQVRLTISDPSRSEVDVARVFEVEVYGMSQ